MNLNLSLVKKTRVFFFVIFLFYFFLAFNLPLTGDDWTWGSNEGILRLQNKFADYNGRYVSNILEIILTRYDFIRYLTLAGLSSLLVYFVGKLTQSKESITTYLLSFIFLLLVNTRVFSQTFGWTAGFVNYVASLVLIVAFLLLTKNIYESSKPAYSKWAAFGIIPLGIITPLFVEHVSLFAIFAAMYVIVYTFIKFKKFYFMHIAYFISIIIGNMIMFSNGAYWNVISGEDDYRTIREGAENMSFLQKVYDVYSGNMYNFLFFFHPILNVFIGVLLIIVIASILHKMHWINRYLKPALLSVVIGFLLYQMAFKSLLGNELLFAETNDFEAVISLFFYLSIVAAVALFVDEAAVRSRLLFYLAGVILLTAPFIFVTPYGPRGVLASYLFFVLFGIELFMYCTNKFSWPSKLFVKPLVCAAFLLVLSYVHIFSEIGLANRERLAFLESELIKNEKTIYLPEIPYSEFLWMSSPPNEHFHSMFKEFYRIPKNAEVVFVPYREWKQKHWGILED